MTQAHIGDLSDVLPYLGSPEPVVSYDSRAIAKLVAIGVILVMTWGTFYLIFG